MYDWNGSIRSLNVGLPDDIARLKAAGYYQEAIARIDRLLAEDWTKTQNGPASNGIAPPEGYVPPENPTPHGVDALREALTVQKEIMRRLPGEYCWTEAEAIARMQERVKDFTAEEFKKLDWEGRMDWRFVEGEKRYQARFAETLPPTTRTKSATASTRRRSGRGAPAPTSPSAPASGCPTKPSPPRWKRRKPRAETPSTSGHGWPCLPPARPRAISRWTASPRRPAISPPRTRPSAPSAGRPT